MPLSDTEKNEIQRLLEAQGDGKKFKDPDFPTGDETLTEDSREMVVAWRRPRKVVDRPVLFEDGVNSMDVTQGQLGDCWFLSAAAAVAQYPELMNQVIPEDQHLYGKEHKGILVFRFWRMGEWISVYIDDRLPIDEDTKLVYACCSSKTEFWLPLLEKAFAKFHGGYKNLDGGYLAEGLLSLTGFIVEDISMGDFHVRQMHSLITVELKNKSVITCATSSPGESRGLVNAHAYTVTGVGRVRLGDSLSRLVRVRNPHAEGEWQGPWSDSDPNWDEIDGQKLEDLGYKNTDDGQFWIKMSHFMKNFSDITFAARVPDFDDSYETSSLQMYTTKGSWQEGLNAGGSIENKESFLTNPQFTLIIQDNNDSVNEIDAGDEGDGDDGEIEEGLSEVLIELIQEHDRSKYEDLHSIGITCFKVEDPSQRSITVEDLDKPYKKSFYNNSSIVMCVEKPGTYIILPSTKEPGINRKFLMRVYARTPITFLP